MGNKYFGVFIGMCLLSLVFGLDCLMQSRTNQQASQDELSTENLPFSENHKIQSRANKVPYTSVAHDW